MSLRAALGLLVLVIAVTGCRGERRSRGEPYVVAVIVREPGLSVADVESTLALPIEAALADVRSLASLRTESREGSATVIAELAKAAGQGEAAARLDAIRRTLPEGVYPELRLAAPDAPADLVLEVRGAQSPIERTRIARDLVPRIEAVAGVREAHARGGQERHLEVRVDPARLVEVGLTVVDVASAVAGGREPGDAVAWQALRERAITERDGHVVRLADVATLAETVAPEPPDPVQLAVGFTRGADRYRAARTIASLVTGASPGGVTIARARGDAGAPRVVLTGEDAEAVARAADQVAEALGVEQTREPEVRITVDRERAAQLGVHESEIARAIAVAMGQPLGHAGDSTDVVLRVEVARPEDVLDAVHLRDARGGLVPLSAVSTRTLGHAEPMRLRIDRRPAVEWPVPGRDAAELRDRLAQLALPPRVHVRVQD